MASIESARKNNLNDRARKAGRPADEELSTQDIDTLEDFYNHRCLNCGAIAANSPDHVIPLSKGGENKLSNLQLLCVSCNKAKGDDETDYRKGVICSDDLHQEQERKGNEKQTYKRHDWETVEKEYITASMPTTTLELSTKHDIPYPTIRDYAIRHEWVKRRDEFRSGIVESAREDIAETLKKPLVNRELSARATLFQVIENAVSAWESNPKPTTRELAELLKLGLVAQGGITDRTAHVADEPDEAAILARINKAFDTGEEERTYSPLGPDGEEQGAEWTDPF